MYLVRKWYMKWIIYELRIWNQVKLWSSQLRTQFLQLRKEAWNPFHISFHRWFIPHGNIGTHKWPAPNVSGFIEKKKIVGNHTFFRENYASIWKRTPYIAYLYFLTFYKYCSLIIFEKCVVTPKLFSFWISITLVKICFSRIVTKPRKNTFE